MAKMFLNHTPSFRNTKINRLMLYCNQSLFEAYASTVKSFPISEAQAHY